MKVLKALETALNYVAVEICGWITLVLVLLVSFDVILRYIFVQSIPGVIEISQVLLTFTVFLVLGAVQERKDHVRIDFFIERMPIRIRRYWEATISVVSAVFFIALLIFCWQAFTYSYAMKEYYGSAIRIPIYPARAAIFIGVGLLVLSLLKDLLELFFSKEDKVPIAVSADQREIEEAIEREEALESRKKN